MSCYDWPALLAHRFSADGAVPEAWQPAVGHLSGCGACRRVVASIDPTVLLADLPPPPAPEGEADAMRRAVRSLRRARAMERRVARRPAVAARWTAAAAIAAALLLPAHLAREPLSPPASESLLRSPASAELFRPAPELGAPPLIDALDRPGARVYQLSEEGLSLAIVVDESLDV